MTAECRRSPYHDECLDAGGKGYGMPQEPKRGDPKVRAYDKPERGGNTTPIITAVVIIIAILLVLWLFTDIL
jgi:hypothetical protein